MVNNKICFDKFGYNGEYRKTPASKGEQYIFKFKNGYGAMLSIVLPDDKEKMNAFMRRLQLAHYAMTLGGYRTTLSHPVMSSHYDVPEEMRKKIGITFGLLRISVGIENAEELVEDFLQALEVFSELKEK